MTLLKCKFCGGETEVPLGATTAECKYCGEKLPLMPETSQATGDSRINQADTKKDTLYAAGVAYMRPRVENIDSYEAAIAAFVQIPGWKDADEQLLICRDKIAQLKAQEEARRLKLQKQAELAHTQSQKRIRLLKTVLYIALPVVCVLAAVALILQLAVFPQIKKDRFIQEYGQAVYDRFGIVEPGAYLTLGICEQDDLASDGMEDIEWLVLEVRDGKALVVSRYGMTFLPYHEVDEDTTWEQCSLRRWLNNDFIGTVFTAEEAALIPTVTVLPDPSPEYDTDPGNPTQDRVFLLSAAEAARYFNSDMARRCIATETAETETTQHSGNTGAFDWWLRTPGEQQNKVATVGASGYILTRFGSSVNNSQRYVVRPAMWIDFSSVGK